MSRGKSALAFAAFVGALACDTSSDPTVITSACDDKDIGWKL